MAIDEEWFSKRQCRGVRGLLVEMGKATKKENLGSWYVRDWLQMKEAKLHTTFRAALEDYLDRCLTLHNERKAKK